MKPFKIILCSLCFVFSLNSNGATMPQDLRYHEPVVAIEVLPVTQDKEIWHVENHQNPIVSFGLSFKNAGSKADPHSKKGLCDFLSALLDEGCGEMTSIDVKKYLLKYNIELSINGGNDSFTFTFRCPKESIKQAFDLLKLMLTSPRFDKAPFERTRHQLVQSYQASLVNDRKVAYEKISQVLYGDHVYAQSLSKKIEESKFISPDDLKTFMKERFCQDEAIIGCVGDLTKEEVQSFVQDLLKTLPENSKKQAIQEVTLQGLGSTTSVELDVPQSVIAFAQPGIKRSDEDFYAAYVACKILADGSFESRLWDVVREKNGLAYYVSADLQWFDHSQLVFGITATNGQNAPKVMELIKSEWQKIIDQGVTQEELDFVKGRLIGAFSLNFDSTIQILSALLMYQHDGLTPSFIKERNHFIQNLTLEKINEVSKKLFNTDTLTFVVVGK